jgi:hypothetical protein
VRASACSDKPSRPIRLQKNGFPGSQQASERYYICQLHRRNSFATSRWSLNIIAGGIVKIAALATGRLPVGAIPAFNATGPQESLHVAINNSRSGTGDQYPDCRFHLIKR